jgi:pyruvate phosphate dikinase (EC 2.7.9.1)
LTQTVFGFSRDDIGSFLPDYLNKNILKTDPFIELDRNGVGELMKIAVQKGIETRPDIKLGICGEHGGDPGSIEFCHRLKLNMSAALHIEFPLLLFPPPTLRLKIRILGFKVEFRFGFQK